jgi:hypothetical protein
MKHDLQAQKRGHAHPDLCQLQLKVVNSHYVCL